MSKPSTFWSRNRRVILSTFFTVFFLNFLFVLFEAPVYQATASVEGPPASDPTAQAKALQTPDLMQEAAAKIEGTGTPPGVDVRVIDSGALMPGRYTVIVESESPQYAAALANAWADTVIGDSAGKAKLVVQAQVPAIPIRPKKARSLLLGALFGVILGIVLGCIRDARRPPLALTPVDR